MRHSFMEFIGRMIPLFVYESIGVTLLRVALELGLACKNPNTPGRIVSAVHSLACAMWISSSDWQSAISATFLYFMSDGIMNLASQPSNILMMVHHILGAVLCFAAIHFRLWEGDTPEAAITNSLIMMETTSITVQAAFISYHEFEYADLMTPALLHFIVVRVLCVGHPILTHYEYVKASKSLVIHSLYVISCLLWLQQIAWSFLWTQRLLKELCKTPGSEKYESEKKKED